MVFKSTVKKSKSHHKGNVRHKKKQGFFQFIKSSFIIFMTLNLQAFIASLGKLWRTPISSILITFVIGISLALPSGLYVFVDSAQKMTGSWEQLSQISLFLKHDISHQQAQDFAIKLKQQFHFNDLHTISKENALEEFKILSGFGDALNILDTNPLPEVIIINLEITHNQEQLKQIRVLLQKHPEVDIAQIDMQWMKKLYAIFNVIKQSTIIISLLLALAVLLIIGNTIRLDIQNKTDEIKVTKLVGATNAFIRRPFLYNGLWYGILGGVIACLCLSATLWFLDQPVQHLAILYNSQFQLEVFNFRTYVTIIAIGSLLGVLGSMLSVNRHISEIEPT